MSMHRLRIMMVFLGLAFLLLAIVTGASANQQTVTPSAPSPRDSGQARPRRPPLPRTSTVIVTLRDNNGTLKLRLGDTMALALDLDGGGLFNWTDVTVDPSYLKLMATTHQGVYSAQQHGTTMITAVGTPKCYPRCLMPSVLFKITVVIQ
ncbi:MAG: hypothetical protein U0822_00450 [Anaerolineae bacterium]